MLNTNTPNTTTTITIITTAITTTTIPDVFIFNIKQKDGEKKCMGGNEPYLSALEENKG